jgi:hypothetical protein
MPRVAFTAPAYDTFKDDVIFVGPFTSNIYIDVLELTPRLDTFTLRVFRLRLVPYMVLVSPVVLTYPADPRPIVVETIFACVIRPRPVALIQISPF